MIIVLSILLRIMASIYPFDIFKPLVIAVFVLLRILWYLQTFGHCSVCPSSYPLISSNLWSLQCLSFFVSFGIFKPLVIAVFVLLRILWYLQTFGHCSVCPSSYPLISSNLWSLQCLSFFVSFGIFKPLVIAVFVLLRILWYLQTFGHCSVCPSSYPLVSSKCS